MISLEIVNDPLSSENVHTHQSILNSHPAYNLLVVGKESLTEEEIREETAKNLEMGEMTLHIKQREEIIGIITYLPEHPQDNHTWIGLFAIHKNFEGGGAGTKAWGLFENLLKEQNRNSLRLCVQHGNVRGASFWKKNGFVEQMTKVDEQQNQVDVMGKYFCETTATHDGNTKG